MAKIKNPLTLVNTGGQDEPTSPIIKLTAYDRNTGIITGEHLGTTAGTIYMLDRDTNTYISQPVTSWTDTSITLTTPLDLANLEGTTSIAAVMPDGTWSTKLLVTGDIAVTGYGKLYIQDADTRAISTVSLSSLTEANSLAGNSLFCSIGGVTYWRVDIVGFQFGEDFAATSLNQYYLANIPNLNQPIVLPTSLTSVGNYFLYAGYSFNQPLKLNQAKITNSNFLSNCYSFNQPLDITRTTSFGGSFLAGCFSFNQPLDLSNATALNSNFLINCTAFNQPLDISNVSGAMSNFLQGCLSFNQPLDVSHRTQIPGSFLAGCVSFNQPLNLSNVTSIGESFLDGCRAFNQPLDISKVTTISQTFLRSCSAFNQKLNINASVTTLNNYFMAHCTSFNQPLDLSHVTTIGNWVLCASSQEKAGRFNQPLDVSRVTSIGSNFLAGSAFNQPLDLSSVTSISSSFLTYCTSFNSAIRLPTTSVSLGTGFLSYCYSFNQPLDVSHIKTFDGSFMRECRSFNQPLSLTSAETIGSYFMLGCPSFTYPVTIPSTVTSIAGDRFLSGCGGLTKLTINTTTVPTSINNYTLSASSNGAKDYIEGLRLYGPGATAWKSAIPDRTSSPYRKLIDMTV